MEEPKFVTNGEMPLLVIERQFKLLPKEYDEIVRKLFETMIEGHRMATVEIGKLWKENHDLRKRIDALEARRS